MMPDHLILASTKSVTFQFLNSVVVFFCQFMSYWGTSGKNKSNKE